MCWSQIIGLSLSQMYILDETVAYKDIIYKL